MTKEELAKILNETCEHSMTEQLRAWGGHWIYEQHTIYMAAPVRQTLRLFKDAKEATEWFNEQGFHVEALDGELISIQKTFNKGDVSCD